MVKADCVDAYLQNGQCYADLDVDRAAQVLAGAIRFPTVSYADTSRMDGEAFTGLHAWFEECFPLVHKTLKRTVINRWSLLFYWPGSDPTLKPALFMSHLDVVPVNEGTEQDWAHPPFAGEIADGFVWGRGALDTKGMVVAELTAVEYLIAHGYTPKRGLYLGFGHDEESMGPEGSLGIMEHLKAQGVQLEFVLDEGGGFSDGGDFGAPGQILGKVAIFEKGYADIAVSAQGPGGHSSRPGKGTSLGRVCRAVAAIEKAQFAPSMCSVLEDFFTEIAPIVTEEPFKTWLSDLPAHRQELIDYLNDRDDLAPLVHTTTAATMISGSPAPNVLPQRVEAVINFRTSPGDSCQAVVEHCIQAAGDPEVQVTLLRGLEPSKISRSRSLGMDIIRAATQKFYHPVTVVPMLVTGGTDCRYFEEICDCCYRFRPLLDNMPLASTGHNTNERCSIHAYGYGIKVILEIMKNACC